MSKKIAPFADTPSWNKNLRQEVPFWLTALAQGKTPELLFSDMMSNNDDFYQLSFFLNQLPATLIKLYFEKIKMLLHVDNSSHIDLGVAALLIAVPSLTQEQYHEIEEIIDMNLNIDESTEQLIAFAASSFSNRFNPQLITVELLQYWLLKSEYTAYAKVAVDILSKSIVPLENDDDIDNIFSSLINGPMKKLNSPFPFNANFYQVFANLEPYLDEGQIDQFLEYLKEYYLYENPNVYIKFKKIAVLLGEGVPIDGWDGNISSITPEEIIALFKHEGEEHLDNFEFNGERCCTYLDDELCILTDNIYLEEFTPAHINALLEVAINSLNSSSNSTTYYSSYAILRLGTHLTTEQISRVFQRGLISHLVNPQYFEDSVARIDLLLYCILHKNATLDELKNFLNISPDLLVSEHNKELIDLLSDVINYIGTKQDKPVQAASISSLFTENGASFFKSIVKEKRSLEESMDEAQTLSSKFTKYN
ncbi:hypothetical protein ACD661_05130 [Legionella lytica]|uniref:Uncharacterized protein n=1 Tax=Legionella lytica TaxID=96232 RepID=A0ABW8D5H3_9GAMM